MEISPTHTKHLAHLVDELLKALPTMPAQDHAAYLQRRQRFYQLATLSHIVGSDKESGILESWSELQNHYASHARTALAKKKETLRSEDLKLYKDEIAKLEPLERERDALWEEMRKSRTAPDPKRSERFAELQKKLSPLSEYRAKFEALSHALEQVTRVDTDLESVLKMPLQEKINVVLEDPEKILADLEKGMYTGLKIELYNQFAPEQGKTAPVPLAPVAPVTPNAKPKELLALLGLKAAVDRRAPNVSFTAVIVSGEVPAGMEPRIVGTYLKDASAIFGVEQVQGNTFKKLPHQPFEEGEFIARILDHLRPADQAEINRFYLNRALQRIREDSKKGYTPFTVEDVLAAVKPDGFPMSAKAVAVNLGRYSERFGVKYTQEERRRQYEFTEVMVTEAHKEQLRLCIPKMGHRPFNLIDLGRKILESDGYMHLRIIETALQKPSPYGLRKNRDGTYESLARPDTATTALARAREGADVSDLV